MRTADHQFCDRATLRVGIVLIGRQEDVAVLRQIPGYQDFNPKTETLQRLKAVYGLKGAPRAWRKRLHQALQGFKLTPLIAEAELYVRHLASPRGKSQHKLDKLQELHNRDEAAKKEKHYTPKFNALEDPKLEAIVSTPTSMT